MSNFPAFGIEGTFPPRSIFPTESGPNLDATWAEFVSQLTGSDSNWPSHPISNTRTRQEHLTQTAWKEDATFIRSVATGELKCRRRADFFWTLASHGINVGPYKQWDDEILAMVLGLVEEGLWGWAEGDEEYLAMNRTGSLAESIPPHATQTLAKALHTRHEGRCSQLVRSAGSTAIRCGIICWLALESQSAKRLDEQRGWTDRSRWRSPFRRWKERMDHLLDSWDTEMGLEFVQMDGFSRNMETAGHCCHQPHYHDLQRWLLIRSIVSPETKFDAICLNDLWHELKDRPYEGICGGCRKAARIFSETIPQQVDGDGFRFPRVLLLLEILVAYVTDFGEELQIAQLESLQPFMLPLQLLTLQHVEAMLDQIPLNAPSPIYQPWVNRFPTHWRTHISQRRPSFWYRLSSLLPIYPNLVSPSDEEIDLCGWMNAILLVLLGKSQENPRDILYSSTVVDVLDIESSKALLPLKALIPTAPTQAEAKFQAAIEQSYHTCWEGEDDALYARAMSALHGTDNIPVVGLDLDDAADSQCLPCKVGAVLQQNVRLPPSSESSFVQGLFNFINGPRKDVEISSSPSPSPLPQENVEVISIPHSPEPEGLLAQREPTPSKDDPRPMSTSPPIVAVPYLQPGPTSQGPKGTSTFSSRPFVKRGKALETIKVYLVSLLHSQGLRITDNKIPWKTLPALLGPRNLEFVNWPTGEVPLPGSDGSNDKGLNGLSKTQLDALYEVVEGRTLDIRPMLENRGLIRMSEEVVREDGMLRKRRRDDGEGDDVPLSRRPRV